jgi:hypothetical protein
MFVQCDLLIQPSPAMDFDAAVEMLALILNGEAEHDGCLIRHFCADFSLSPEKIYRAIFGRVNFPNYWTEH